VPKKFFTKNPLTSPINFHIVWAKEIEMGKVSEEKLDRNAEIYLRRKSGEGPKALAEEYDLSPNRIWKIFTQYEKRHVNA